MITDVLTALLAIVSAVLVVFTARRILGEQVGRPRSFLTGLAVVFTGIPFARWSLERAFPPGDSGGIVVDGGEAAFAAICIVLLALAWVFAVGLAVLVGLEILVPTRPLTNPITAVRAALARRRRARRYMQLLALASQRGAGWVFRGITRSHAQVTTSRERADALVATLNTAGVTFVKLGQVLSTRRDLVPEPYVSALATLQSQAQRVAWDEVRSALETELKRPIEAVFSSIDPEPLAAASLAQVHAATLEDGTPVIVKVQRPGAHAQVTADADIIQQLSVTAERRSPLARDLGLSQLAKGFTQSLLDELDYRREGRNADMIRETAALIEAADHAIAVYVPRIHAEASTAKVLTMDLVAGTPLSRAEDALTAMTADERDRLATVLMTAVLQQILVYGVFHADLHPGNVILRPDGALGLIDFGAVGIVERSQRELLTTLLLAVLSEDDIAARDALLLIVERPPDLDVRALTHDIGTVLTTARYSGSTGGSIFSRMVDIIRDHRLALPANLAAAFRSFATLEGCLHAIAPGYDMVQHGLPLMPKLIRSSLSLRRAAIDVQARDAVTAAQLHRLPRQISDLVSDVRNGVVGRGPAESVATTQRQAFSLAVSTVVSLGTAALATVLVVTDGGPMLAGSVRGFDLLGSALGLFGFLGLLRVVLVSSVRRGGRPGSTR